jgi:uncharacterized protein
MSDHFVKDPLDAVKVGDVLEFRVLSLDRDRRRIGLTRKSEVLRPERAVPAGGGEKSRAGGAKREGGGTGGTNSTGGKDKRKLVVTAKPDRPRTGTGCSAGPAASSAPGPAAYSGRSARPDDDGTMYNPFAEALKKMRENKRG